MPLAPCAVQQAFHIVDPFWDTIVLSDHKVANFNEVDTQVNFSCYKEQWLLFCLQKICDLDQAPQLAKLLLVTSHS